MRDVIGPWDSEVQLSRVYGVRRFCQVLSRRALCSARGGADRARAAGQAREGE